ncbi:MAG: hypothetical protein NTU67_12175 [Gemmatimonadetes bacterium]|nr:hypothetical protein [Gemmatimonadota bacterium]
MNTFTRWARATLATIWNVLAVHGLFRIEDRFDLREMVVTITIALVVSWAVLRWYGTRPDGERSGSARLH